MLDEVMNLLTGCSPKAQDYTEPLCLHPSVRRWFHGVDFARMLALALPLPDSRCSLSAGIMAVCWGQPDGASRLVGEAIESQPPEEALASPLSLEGTDSQIPGGPTSLTDKAAVLLVWCRRRQARLWWIPQRPASPALSEG